MPRVAKLLHSSGDLTFTKSQGHLPSGQLSQGQFAMRSTKQQECMSNEANSYHLPLPQEYQKVLYYRPEEEISDRKVRNIGLCEAMVNFTKTFAGDRPCEVVHTQRLRQVFFEPEEGTWMVMVRKGVIVNLLYCNQ